MKRSGSSSARTSRRSRRRASTAILEVAQRAVAEALELHRVLGNPVAEWRDGRVVWVPAASLRKRS
jgi:hypothetical protein